MLCNKNWMSRQHESSFSSSGNKRLLRCSWSSLIAIVFDLTTFRHAKHNLQWIFFFSKWSPLSVCVSAYVWLAIDESESINYRSIWMDAAREKVIDCYRNTHKIETNKINDDQRIFRCEFCFFSARFRCDSWVCFTWEKFTS